MNKAGFDGTRQKWKCVVRSSLRDARYYARNRERVIEQVRRYQDTPAGRRTVRRAALNKATRLREARIHDIEKELTNLRIPREE